jgi:hypothetical protein
MYENRFNELCTKIDSRNGITIKYVKKLIYNLKK